MPDPSPCVRRARAGDGPALRALRLQMLADTPTAFVHTVEEEAAHPAALWESRALGGPTAQTWLLESDRVLGQAVCSLEDGRAWLAAVFLDPSVRGAGHLGSLVAAAAGWASDAGHDALWLEVARENPRAVTAYQRLGFLATGVTVPHPLYPGVTEVEMVLRRRRT